MRRLDRYIKDSEERVKLWSVARQQAFEEAVDVIERHASLKLQIEDHLANCHNEPYVRTQDDIRHGKIIRICYKECGVTLTDPEDRLPEVGETNNWVSTSGRKVQGVLWDGRVHTYWPDGSLKSSAIPNWYVGWAKLSP